MCEAPAHGHVPVAIHDADVARMQPATAQGFRCLLRLAPITLHETTAQAHFADLAQRHETAKLALAVALDQRQLELVAPGALERARHRAAAGEAEPQAARRAAAPA